MRPDTHCSTSPEVTMAVISSALYPEAYNAAMMAPIEVPDT